MIPCIHINMYRIRVLLGMESVINKGSNREILPVHISKCVGFVTLINKSVNNIHVA